ncbi:MAG: hypothetical protein HN368_23705 [Spirochaetales bacterium]|jgi:hypothetical protein|nr:hypothetical protein [Spirochaetales bacterium]
MSDELPVNPNIEQLKKQAKDLLRGFARKDPSVIDRFRSIRRYASLSEKDLFRSPVKLNDAQYAVALHYGFKSWRHLSDHCIQKHKETAMNRTAITEFNELKDLPHRAIQRILRQIDTFDLARALMGADKGTREKIFANMSTRAVEMIEEEISSLEGVEKSIIKAGMAKVILVYQKLVNSGDISDRRAGPNDEVTRGEPVKIISDADSGDFTIEDLKKLFSEISIKAKSHGLLSLESDAQKIDDPIIKKGLELVIDGTDPEIVESILHNMLERDLRFIQTKYSAVIEAVLGVQEGNAPQILLEKMEARLP